MTDTAIAIVRAAAALVAPAAPPIVENLELVQDMAESAAAYLESEAFGALSIEVSAVRGFGTDAMETCNDEPERAQGFGVYIRNPTAFHVQDFAPETVDEAERVTMREAHLAAFRYAGGLAEHLGCDVWTSLAIGPDYWPARFVVEPQRDYGPPFPPVPGPIDETRFMRCEEADATQWALLKLDVAPGGAPIAGTGELVEDYPTREAAEAARDALERRQPLPDPVWPEPIGVDVTAERLAVLGFAVEGGGAGAAFMSRTVQHPASASRAAIVIATDGEGGDLPRADSWRLGVYLTAQWEAGGEPSISFDSASNATAALETAATMAAACARNLVFPAHA